MNRKVGTLLVAIGLYSGLVFAQETAHREARLNTRQAPPPQPPDEQLLPLSAVPSFVVPHPKNFPQKYAAVFMPVSLAIGKVRTPEFRVVKGQWYALALQVEVPQTPKSALSASAQRIRCLTGATLGPLDEQDCGENHRVFRADWTVWEAGRIVHWGSVPEEDGGSWSTEVIVQMGGFGLESGKSYVVQVHFTQDGTALDSANPHLLVIPHRDLY